MSRMLVCFGINGTDTVIALAIEVFRLESNSNRAPYNIWVCWLLSVIVYV